MSAEHVITRKAVDGELTVPELRLFLQEVDKVPGPSGTVKLRVRAGVRGQVKSITVTIPGGEEKR